MIYIFTALFCEAAPLIRAWNLKKTEKNLKWDVYVDEEKTRCLVITGVGPVASAAAVSAVFTKFEAAKGDVMINIGTCCVIAGKTPSERTKIGDILLINKLTDGTTGRDFYPDMNVTGGIKESAITSVTEVISAKGGRVDFHGGGCPEGEGASAGEGDKYGAGCPEGEGASAGEGDKYGAVCPESEGTVAGVGDKAGSVCRESASAVTCKRNCIAAGVYDMEAAFIYQTAKFYMGPGQMYFLKVVSDNGVEFRENTNEPANEAKYRNGLKEYDNGANETVNGVEHPESTGKSDNVFESREMPEKTNADSKFETPPENAEAGGYATLAKRIGGLMEAAEGKITEFVAQVRSESEKEEGRNESADEECLRRKFTENHVFEDLHATAAMEKKLIQAIRYAELAGIDYEPEIKKLYDNERLPAKSKKEGILLMEEIVSKIQRGESAEQR